MGLVLAVLIAAGGHPHEAYFDARVQLDGARDVLSGTSPYGVYYQSPLWSAFFLMPFAALPETVRYTAWFWANVLAWGAACLLLATVARTPGGWPGRVLAASLLMVYPPAVWSMHGQMDGFMALGLAGSLALWPAHPLGAGLLLAVLAVKPHLAAFPVALMFLAALRSGHRRIVVGMLTGGLALLAVSVAVQPSWPGQWLDVVSHPPADMVLGRSKFAQTVSGFTGLWVPGWLAGAFGWVVAVAVVIAAGRWVWVEKPATPNVAAVGVGALFLVTPYAQGYDLSLLVVPMALALGRSLGAPIVAGVALTFVFAMAMATFEWPQPVLVLSAPVVLGLWWLSRR
jgi:glycosyl transferase family 87